MPTPDAAQADADLQLKIKFESARLRTAERRADLATSPPADLEERGRAGKPR